MGRQRGPADKNKYKHINHDIGKPEGKEKKEADTNIANNILRMNDSTVPDTTRIVPEQQPLPPVISLPEHIKGTVELEKQRQQLLENEARLRKSEESLTPTTPITAKNRISKAIIRNSDNLEKVNSDLKKISDAEESKIRRHLAEKKAVENDKVSTPVVEEKPDIKGNKLTELEAMKAKMAKLEEENRTLSESKEEVEAPVEEIDVGDEAIDKTLNLDFKLDDKINRSIKISSLTNNNHEDLKDDVNDIIIAQDELTEERRNKAVENGEDPDLIPEFEFNDETKELFTYLNAKFTYSDGEDMLYPQESYERGSIIKKKTIKAENASRNQNAFFSSVLGIGTPVEVSLPVSAFRITFRHAEKPELIKFIRDLDGNKDKIGFQTVQTGYRSFEDFHISTIVMDFVSSLIISSTLDVENPIDYVLEDDFPNIYSGLTTTMFPNGVPLTIPCNGVSVLDGLESKCKRVSTGRVDTSLIDYVDKDKVPQGSKDLLSREKPSSISLEEYEKNIENNSVGGVESFQMNGNDIEIEFDHLNYSTYKQVGNKVIELMSERLENAFKDEDFNVSTVDVNGNRISDEAIQSRIDAQVNKVMVAGFSDSELKKAQHIHTLRVNGEEFTDFIKNIESLDLIIRTEEGLEAFNNGVDKFRESNPTMIGLPVYNCGCGNVRGDASGIIPINPLRLLKVAVMVKE